MSGEVLSDDEDEGLEKLDAGRGNSKGLSRKDFGSDEEFYAYKQQQEAAPKAAFQYGVKAGAGRLSKDGRDKKLNKDLGQIRKMISEKHGDKHDLAFKKPDGDAGGGAGGGGRGRVDDDGDDAAKRSKRIRL